MGSYRSFPFVDFKVEIWNARGDLSTAFVLRYKRFMLQKIWRKIMIPKNLTDYDPGLDGSFSRQSLTRPVDKNEAR